MCGRFTVTTDIKAIADRFSAPTPPAEWSSVKPRYNIASTQDVIVVSGEGRRQIRQMRWGLIPSWAKNPAIGSQMINAGVIACAEAGRCLAAP